MAETLRTSRLLLSPWAPDDFVLLTRMASDPTVMRYIGNGRPWSEQRAVEVSQMVSEHWRLHGFGWRSAVLRETQEPVGFAILQFLGQGTTGLDPREFEIGWWLVPEVWRQGLATEGARAICQEAFERIGAPSLVARLQPENHASAGVALRLGMSHESETTGRFGETVSVYRLLFADWAAARRGTPGAARGRKATRS